MKNKLVIGTIVGQAIVTLVAIGYGASAHSSWEAERQRRMDGERAAVAEMAAAMKGAGERLDKVEQELKRCRVRARRAARLRPATSAPVAEPAPTPTPVAFSTDDRFRLLAGPIAWASPPSVQPRPAHARP